MDAKWEIYEGELTRFPKDFVHPATQAIIMLHGTNLSSPSGAAEANAEYIIDTGQELLEYADCTNTVLVLPESGHFTIDGIPQQNWDYTHHFTYGSETADLIKLIRTIQKQGISNIWLHGGSGGGLMAWRVAIELERVQHLSKIKGLIITECVSPFSVSSTPNPPTALKGLDSYKQFSFEGFDFYDSIKDTFAFLGLPNGTAKFTKQILFQFSRDDFVVPSQWKLIFGMAIKEKATDFTAKSSGTGHDLGPEGWTNLVEWLTERDNL